MTSRSDIIDGTQAMGRKYGLIYTKKCGWIDLGHANPESAADLWNRIKLESPEAAKGAEHFRVSYKQMMGRKNFKLGVRKTYKIKAGLGIDEKKSVALSIFLGVSHTFESMQSSWPFRLVTNSGYSAEDLLSNLLGFYRAVNPSINYLMICEPVSKSDALKIWDKYGPVGDNKNYEPAPYLYPIPPASGGPMCGTLPRALSTIQPAKPGTLFEEVR